MKFNVIADTHYFGADPVKEDFSQLLKKIDDYFSKTIILGDFIDLKNCEKKKLHEAKSLFKLYKDSMGAKYLNGNHECQQDIDVPLVTLGIGFMHGDRIFNGFLGHIESRRHPLDGAGKFQRLLKGAFSKLRNVVEWNDDKLDREDVKYEISKIAKEYGLHTIVCGHCHPSHVIDRMVEGIRIIIVPRGITTLEL